MQSRISWTRAWSSALGQAADSFWPDMVRLAFVFCVVGEIRSENARVHCGCSPRREFVEEELVIWRCRFRSSTGGQREKMSTGRLAQVLSGARRQKGAGVHPTSGLPNATGGTGPVQGAQFGDEARPPRNTSSSKAKPISNRQPHTGPVSIADFNHDTITQPLASPSRSRSLSYSPFDSARTSIQNVDRSLVSPNLPAIPAADATELLLLP